VVLVLRDHEERGLVQVVAVEVAEELKAQLFVAPGVLTRLHVVGKELEEWGNWGGGIIIERGTCNAFNQVEACYTWSTMTEVNRRIPHTHHNGSHNFFSVSSNAQSQIFAHNSRYQNTPRECHLRHRRSRICTRIFALLRIPFGVHAGIENFIKWRIEPTLALNLQDKKITPTLQNVKTGVDFRPRKYSRDKQEKEGREGRKDTGDVFSRMTQKLGLRLRYPQSG